MFTNKSKENIAVKSANSISTDQSLAAPLIEKVQGNPEFTRWWKRWASRVQRVGMRRNLPARRAKLERREETRHRNPDLQAAGASSRECEFKRYL